MKDFTFFSKKIFFSLLLFFVFSNSYSQHVDWIKTAASAGSDISEEIVYAGANVYVIGSYNGTILFGTTSLTSVNRNDLFVAAYDTSGNFKWVKSYNSGGKWSNERIDNLVVDDEGYLYLSGFYDSTITFGTYTLTANNSDDSFVLKMDTNGNVIWAKKLSSYLFRRSDMSTDGKSIYLMQEQNIPLYYDGASIGVTVPANSQSWCLLKIENTGDLSWAKVLHSNGVLGMSYGIVEASGSGVYLAGDYEDDLQLGAFSLNPTSLNSRSDLLYMAKLDTSGNIQWLKSSSLSTNNNDLNFINANDIELDPQGNVYFAGSWYGEFKWDTLSLDSGLYNTIIMKLSPNGNILRTHIYRNANSSPHVQDIELDSNSNLFASGHFRDTLIFGSKVLSSIGQRDILIFKMDSSGKEKWAFSAGSTFSNFGSSIALDSNNNIYSTGSYYGITMFGTRYISSVNGTSDIYTAKINKCDFFKADIFVTGDTSACYNGISTAAVQFSAERGIGFLYQWLKDGLQIPGETYPDLFTSDTGSYSVIVNNNGCVDTSRVVRLTHDTIPTVSLLPFDTICMSASPLLLTNGFPAGGNWSGDGVVNGFFDPSQADTGYVRITYSFSNGICADSATQSIYVLSAPKPVVQGQQQVCANTTGVTYSTNSPGPIYNWSVSGGSLISGQGTNSITIDWGAQGIGIIDLVETNSVGCISSTSDTIDISDPVIVASIQGADTICANTGEYSYSINAASLFYSWNVNGGVITSGQGTSSITVDWAVIGKGDISVRLFNSCGSDSTFYDMVLVHASPNAVITGANSLCEGASGIVYQSASSGNNYSWNLNSGGAIGTGQSTSSITVDWSTVGNHSIRLIESNANSCVDTAIYQVDVLPHSFENLSVDICQGSSYNFNGQLLSTAGTYDDTLIASNGCDSIITLNLSVLPILDTFLTTDICQGSSYNFNGQMLGTSGIYSDTLTTSHGCDSIVSLNLTVLPLLNTSLAATICQGSSYNFNGQILSSSGTYNDTLPAVNGCDSIITLNLTMLPAMSTSITTSICQGDSYNFNGQLLSATGIYNDTLPASNGCDSIVSLNLNVLPKITSNITADICQGSSYNFNGQILSTSGTYNDTLIAFNGCDSIVTLNLSVLQQITSSITADICQGSSYNFNGQSLNIAGNYADTLISAMGCDSIVNLNLTVAPIPNDSVIETLGVLTAFTTAASYQWLDCNNANQPILGETNRSFVPSGNGTYSVIVTKNNCTDTSDCIPVIIQGIDENQNNQGISIYPNPAKGFYIIESELNEPVEAVLMDVIGKEVIGRYTIEKGENSMDATDLSKGLYIIQFDTKGGKIIQKLVVD